MMGQKGWRFGEEKEKAVVRVDSLFDNPVMFSLSLLRADDDGKNTQHTQKNSKTEK